MIRDFPYNQLNIELASLLHYGRPLSHGDTTDNDRVISRGFFNFMVRSYFKRNIVIIMFSNDQPLPRQPLLKGALASTIA